jgi:nitronate monooxygenase
MSALNGKSLTEILNIETPLICGAMYPCSNPELVAAVSEAGGIGVVQPLSFVYVYQYDFREALKLVRKLTTKPFGMNVIVEKTSKIYEDRMRQWVDIALEEGCTFFITALGNPDWVVKKAHAKNAIVFHDVTERKWAQKAIDGGVDGLICVNNEAGGHAGSEDPEKLFKDLSSFNVPLVCAGGIGDEQHFNAALKIGYCGVQMGTRFIATTECKAHEDYKQAILKAHAADIVLTDRVTGVPLAVIKTPYLEATGAHLGAIGRYLIRHRRTKHWMRLLLNVKSVIRFKTTNLKGMSSKDFYQAGKSVEGIKSIESAGAIVKRFGQSMARPGSSGKPV